MKVAAAAPWVAGAAAALGYALPSVTALAPVRRHTPRLAGRGRPDHIALTFDDGPHPIGTPEILDILDELDVKATFFVLGGQVAAHRGTAERLAADGHEIGLHGWHHRNSLLVSPCGLRESLRRALDEITATTGVRPRLYRPPYGIATAATFAAAANLRLTPVLWDAWGKDWIAGTTPDRIVATVRRDARGGSTVLQHDSDCTSAPGSWRATAGALRPLVRGWRAEGLTVGPLRDHALGPLRDHAPGKAQLGEHFGETLGELSRRILGRGDLRAAEGGQRRGGEQRGLGGGDGGVPQL
ncbi:MAG TPA: polysaccharide deacetylase family protein [Mycobacterium sp.]|nr:polysaccharide deacetylase family protein [Mycobacterium sp.]